MTAPPFDPLQPAAVSPCPECAAAYGATPRPGKPGVPVLCPHCRTTWVGAPAGGPRPPHLPWMPAWFRRALRPWRVRASRGDVRRWPRLTAVGAMFVWSMWAGWATCVASALMVWWMLLGVFWTYYGLAYLLVCVVARSRDPRG